MTAKAFWQDPYATRLETRVVSVVGNDVTVAETILYALSGGQESDHGTIGGRRVVEARKAGREIVYALECADGLAPGTPVVIEIDWSRRHRLMRLHFAAEIVLELVYQRLGPVEKIGAHIAADKARIDFSLGKSITPLLADLQRTAQALVDANHAITSAFSDAGTETLYWQVDGFARVPCGGTHLRRTGEVGEITLKRKNIGKGKERIEVFVS